MRIEVVDKMREKKNIGCVDYLIKVRADGHRSRARLTKDQFRPQDGNGWSYDGEDQSDFHKVLGGYSSACIRDGVGWCGNGKAHGG